MTRNRMCWRTLSWVAALAVWSLAAGAQEAEWNPREAEWEARTLAVLLDSVDKRIAMVDHRAANALPPIEAPVKDELRLALADCQELAQLLESGSTREETYPLFKRLQARRRLLISLGRSTTAPVLSPEEIDAARAIWDGLASHYARGGQSAAPQ